LDNAYNVSVSFIKYCQPGGSKMTRWSSSRCSLILIF